jgi:3-oxoacyl-[acyl-carrier-protein] synthase-1
MADQNDSSQNIVLTLVESNTAVGLTTEQSAAAIRAGMSGFREHPLYAPIAWEFDPGEDSAKVASHGLIDGFDDGRLYALLIDPLTTLVEESGLSRSAMANGGLYLALPANDEVIQKLNLRRHFLKLLSERLALPTTREFLAVQTGSTGVYQLIERAMEKMRAGEMEFCIVAAVDSYLLHDRLGFYDQNWRLKSDRNPTGFIPGEAASAFLLETEKHARQRKAPVLLRIDGVGGGQEPNPITGDKTSTGAGLTDAIRSLSEWADIGQPWRWVLSDLNGERYKAYEWGVALPRLNKLIAADHEFAHYADTIGDVGAAMAGVQLGCVSEAFSRNYAPAGSALLFAGNDAGNRYAMSVSKVQQGDQDMLTSSKGEN